MDGGMHSSCLTSQICALRKQQQLQGLSDVTEVVQHVLQVLLVHLPASLDENEAGHLHGPTWKAHVFIKSSWRTCMYVCTGHPLHTYQSQAHP